MAKAAPEEQLRLLELQAYDSKLNTLRRQADTVRSSPEIAALQTRVGSADGELVLANTAVRDLERELTRAEDDVQSVVVRLERDEKRLNSGQGTSKELTALQSEVASLSRRRSDLEDIELDVMERMEAARSALETVQQRTEALRTELSALEAARDAALDELERQRALVQQERLEFSQGIEPSLLALYEKTLAKRGVGAARLFHGRSEGSGMELSPGDLAEIAKAEPDAVFMCPDSGCILVRSADWGH